MKGKLLWTHWWQRGRIHCADDWQGDWPKLAGARGGWASSAMGSDHKTLIGYSDAMIWLREI
jgi:hypothetical protein